MLTKHSNTSLGDEFWQWISTSSYNPSHETHVIQRPPTKHQFSGCIIPLLHSIHCVALKDPSSLTLQSPHWSANDFAILCSSFFFTKTAHPFRGTREEEWGGRRNWSKIPQQNQKKNTGLINHIPQTCRNPNNPARNKRYLETWECNPKKWEFGLAQESRVNRNIQQEDAQKV